MNVFAKTLALGALVIAASTGAAYAMPDCNTDDWTCVGSESTFYNSNLRCVQREWMSGSACDDSTGFTRVCQAPVLGGC
jgi:hypothetical protein